MKTYAANELNQYTSIANPVAVGLRGTATNTAVVTVNGDAATRDSVASNVRPWHFALPADNANGGKYTLASIMAVVNPSGTNTMDSVDSATGFVYAPPQNETLAYDDDGNLLSDGRWQYTWNGENRLVCAEEQVCPTNRTLRKVDYAYDHQGRMVWKQISHGGAEAQSWEVEKTLSYLWDDFNIIAETTVADSVTNTTYNVWGLDLDGRMQGAGGVGGLLAVVKDSATYTPAWDANGNIMEYVSEDGTIAAHREYDPFGGTFVATGDANAFTHWFSTKPWCSITGLSEYQYREYSPVLGRWMNRDPIEEVGGVNLRVSCYNSMVDFFDALGLKECGIFVHMTHFVFYEDEKFDFYKKKKVIEELGSCAYYFPFSCFSQSLYDELGDLKLPTMPREEYWNAEILNYADTSVTITPRTAFIKLVPYLLSSAEKMCGSDCKCPFVHITFTWDEEEKSGLRQFAYYLPRYPAERNPQAEGERSRLVEANVMDTVWLLDCKSKKWKISLIQEPSFGPY